VNAETILFVGLAEPETGELRSRLDRAVLAFENLPRILGTLDETVTP
jgi:hypothetical protein